MTGKTKTKLQHADVAAGKMSMARDPNRADKTPTLQRKPAPARDARQLRAEGGPMASSSPHQGAVARARQMRRLQRSAGNTRVNRLVGMPLKAHQAVLGKQSSQQTGWRVESSVQQTHPGAAPSRPVAQRKRSEGGNGLPVLQREELQEEDELQMQAEPGTLERQDLEDEKLHQGKMGPVQRQEGLEELKEEELLQGKFDPVQRQGLEDDELVQGKFATSDTPTQLKGDLGRRENRTGMPDHLKAGIETLSGMSMDDVHVHYNSSEPAQLNALAYTQGRDIEVAPGQERHLAHEGWHAVQQMQGRVKPMMQAKGVVINDDEGLEREADVMGAKAVQMRSPHQVATGPSARATTTEQGDVRLTEASEAPSAAIGASGEKGRLNFLSIPEATARSGQELLAQEITHVVQQSGTVSRIQRMKRSGAGNGVGAPPPKRTARTGAVPAAVPGGPGAVVPAEPAGPPTGPVIGPVASVQFNASHAMTAHGGDARINATWTPGAVDHAVAYTRTAVPNVTVTIPVVNLPAAPAPHVRAQLPGGAALTTVPAVFGANQFTATFPLPGLPKNGVFGQQAAHIAWLISADGAAYTAAGTSGAHQIYWLHGNPQGTLYTTAADRATRWADNDADPATALRMGLNRAVPYDPSQGLTNDPIDVLLPGGGKVCADFANALALLGRSVGLGGTTVMYYGGVTENGVHVWIGQTGTSNTIEHVQPGDHSFTYHALARIGAAEHDAALDRAGIDAAAIHVGKTIYLTAIAAQQLEAATVGTLYGRWVFRWPHTVALQQNDVGNQFVDGTFAALVAYNVAVGADPCFAAANWSITAGALPPGLVIDANYGWVHGTPTDDGPFNFTVTVAAGALISSQGLEIVVAPPP